jgi:sterol desaturase/sphingolipid hydroxylase (fatty acid hydroxylase superfamily)
MDFSKNPAIYHGVAGLHRKGAVLTALLRALSVAAVLVVAFEPPAANELLAAFWAYARSFRAVHSCMFEAGFATASFAVSMGGYKLLDQLAWLQPFRFVARRDAVAKQELGLANSWAMGAGYLGTIYIYHCFKAKPPLDVEAPSARRLGVEVAVGVLAYDVCEFALHLAFHRCAALRQCHKQHHAQVHLTSVETLHQDLPDAVQQVVLNILVQTLSPYGRKHSLSRLLHNWAIPYMLTEIHAGYDAPWSMHNVWPALFGGAKRHEVHHRDGSVYYAEFFKGLDDLVGTVERRPEARNAELKLGKRIELSSATLRRIRCAAAGAQLATTTT